MAFCCTTNTLVAHQAAAVEAHFLVIGHKRASYGCTFLSLLGCTIKDAGIYLFTGHHAFISGAPVPATTEKPCNCDKIGVRDQAFLNFLDFCLVKKTNFMASLSTSFALQFPSSMAWLANRSSLWDHHQGTVKNI